MELQKMQIYFFGDFAAKYTLKTKKISPLILSHH